MDAGSGKIWGGFRESLAPDSPEQHVRELLRPACSLWPAIVVRTQVGSGCLSRSERNRGQNAIVVRGVAAQVG